MSRFKHDEHTINRIKQLALEGLSYESIGVRFGMSKSAVAGLINRNQDSIYYDLSKTEPEEIVNKLMEISDE